MDRPILEKMSIRLERRVRFEGDTDPPFWQVDVWSPGADYHAVGDTPQEALFELAMLWRRKAREQKEIVNAEKA